MSSNLAEYFRSLTGKEALPYQLRYGQQPFASTILTVPTGLGKTLTVILPWLHAIASDHAGTPTRLVIVLPRQNLTVQTSGIANDLVSRSNLDISVQELMGGSGDNRETLRPDRRAIVVCTQDMYLSRALNRGYARRQPRWPIDFALLNQDCLLVFDEVQLMSDGLATSVQLAAFREKFGIFGAAPSVWMSATARPDWLDTVDFRGHRPSLRPVKLEDDDRAIPLVGQRLHAVKYLAPAPEACRTPEGCAQLITEQHRPGERTLVIVNTVPRAREIFDKLKLPGAVLIHSRFRPAERKALAARIAGDPPPEGQVVVATQVLEAGVDISANRLITDAAPWASLVQRFGRVNRYGEWNEARIWWVDKPRHGKSKGDDPAKMYLPYEPDQVRAAIATLENLHSASPADLPGENGPAPWRNVLRRADLLDLFDTSPDLSGNELDVSRFIRSGEEQDCYFAWREFDDPTGQPEMNDEELCPAPIGEATEFAKKNHVYWWNFQEREWLRRDPVESPLFPGIVLLARAKSGGYTAAAGWSPESRKPVPSVGQAVEPADGDGSDWKSFGDYRQSLAAHTQRVCAEMEALLRALPGLGLEPFHVDLQLAAAKHDWGKAHPVMQDTLYNRKARGELLAKQKREDSAQRHDPPHFRHELASALAMIECGDSDLAAYLAAAHHGKIRLSIRSMPGEARASADRRIRGIEDGDVLPECELGGGLTLPEMRLRLGIAELGSSGGGTASWTERVLALRDRLGPFRAAYLEMLLRAADEEASEYWQGPRT